MNDRTKRLSRRNFLLASGAATAATAAAIVATKSSVPTGKNEEKRATRGYQASEHVTNYYRTTKV